jgi:hypothetical protein
MPVSAAPRPFSMPILEYGADQNKACASLAEIGQAAIEKAEGVIP